MCWSENGNHKVLRNFACRNHEGNNGKAMGQVEVM